MATSTTPFYEALIEVLMASLNNFYRSDNWDTARFGKRRIGRAFVERIFLCLNPILRRCGYSIAAARDFACKFDAVVGSHGQGLSNTYNMLTDAYSRRALVEVIAYRVLGYRYVKLWTNTAEYRKACAAAESLPRQGQGIDAGDDMLRLYQTDLRPIGYPITIVTHPISITHQFLLTQYAYEQTDPPLWLCDGDCVIDAGAAWGDTALRFADRVGEHGKIYAFEFEPKNIQVLTKNLKLNAELASRITVVKKALWRNSDAALSFEPSGPGTRVFEGRHAPREKQVSCVSIDDFADSLPRVDFIKMDIEGSELPALQGSEQTIRKYRPRMAISVYHSLSDFVDIPAYLASLGLDYDFYLDHASIHHEETVLFAAPKSMRKEESGWKPNKQYR